MSGVARMKQSGVREDKTPRVTKREEIGDVAALVALAR
jgi:hypothetical protein